MKNNVGDVDRAVRITLGVVLLFVGYFSGFSTAGAVVSYGLAAVMLITGLFRTCPLYLLFGIDTCGTSMKKRFSSR